MGGIFRSVVLGLVRLSLPISPDDPTSALHGGQHRVLAAHGANCPTGVRVDEGEGTLRDAEHDVSPVGVWLVCG